jgi:hypothetical protein
MLGQVVDYDDIPSNRINIEVGLLTIQVDTQSLSFSLKLSGC